MTKLLQFNVQTNSISEFSSLELHPNFYKLKCFKITEQNRYLPKEELRKANKIRLIERPNIQLKEIQNLHQSNKTVLDNCKKEINAVLNCANHIQFTSYAAQLFEQLNQPVSQ
ncbi:Hypothetical_protein [Hexamita inflata]|uniref:Hypothetical_protein n=1 Tax=Hexamita inflata TaxID=28002 RepID=A0AA86V2T8_9EUKA|nr:Hypothetical protein HINF_LOCUS66119 [Hexamita inflata]